MKMFRSLYFIFVFHVGLRLALVNAQDDQSGFISIDCGIAEGSTYTDNRTGINYVSDAGFIDVGVSREIQHTSNSRTVDLQFTTLTSFPENTRNCYTLRPEKGKGNKYLIRASFYYGNYDFTGKPPEFDLYLGSDHWYRIVSSSTDIIDYEIIHLTSSDYIYVCLVNIGLGIPFISALELRLLDSTMYATLLQSMILVDRYNFGSSEIVRYGDDRYDRKWYPTGYANWLVELQTSGTVSLGPLTTENVPSKVMSTAVTSRNSSYPLNYQLPATNFSDEFFMYLHFAEIETLKSNQTRELYIYLNDVYWDGPVTPLDHTASTYIVRGFNSSRSNVTLYSTENSTLPPILNAAEHYKSKQFQQWQTEDQDATAIWSTKSTYRLKRNWNGDPCVPQPSAWVGINCSYNDSENPRIISLNLSFSKLSGEVADSLANLTMIQSLDLSNNSLTGTVPKFLASLEFLGILNLIGNNFTRPLPPELLAKSEKGSLKLIIEDIGDQDKGACPRDSCKKKKHKNVVIPVAITIVVFFALVITLSILWIILRRRTKAIPDEIIEPRNQRFTFREIQSITGNFSTIIGKGGFGTVFSGCIGDKQVAVKLLSESSAQGCREFQAEVHLLMSIHHRNITSLVGYCDEGSQKGIIYEYMENGNLGMHLFDGRPYAMSWKQRLEIGYDAAQGLEYMHNGCTPAIVHRDVKCSNILLNENFRAKLADFGLSRAFISEGDTHVSTAVAGTPGYLDPEYYTTTRLTEKSDVYSFGVVLLELITGRPAISQDMYIVEWVKSMVWKGNVQKIVDPSLQGKFDINTAWKVVELAMSCVHSKSIKRPTMNNVVTDLDNCLTLENGFHGTRANDLNENMSLNLESMRNPNLR